MTAAGAGPDRCWQRTEGEGEHVVLVHGTMDRGSSFGRVARHLDGFRVTRYDRRGYGHSLRLGPPDSFTQQVDDLLAVVGDAPAIVAGHSYGGTIALAAAQRAPTAVVGVVAYESPMPWRDWWPRDSAGAHAVATARDPEHAAEQFMRRMIGDQRWKRLPPSTRDARRAEGPTLVAEMAHTREPDHPCFDPRQITVPVIAAHGTEGAPHHGRSAEVLAEEAPSGVLVVVDGAGHGVHLTHPAAFAGLVDRLAVTIGWRPG